MIGFPLGVRHSVDSTLRVSFCNRTSSFGGRFAVPLTKAVSAEIREQHQVDILSLRPLPEVFDESPKHSGLYAFCRIDIVQVGWRAIFLACIRQRRSPNSQSRGYGALFRKAKQSNCAFVQIIVHCQQRTACLVGLLSGSQVIRQDGACCRDWRGSMSVINSSVLR